MVVAFFGAATSAHAQTPRPTPVDNVNLKACEETADLAKRLKIENDSLKEQLKLKDQQIALEQERTANAKEQSMFWEKASKTGDKIDINSQAVIFQLRQQVADDQVRIHDLESENKSLRNSRNWRTVLGFGAGFGTGYYIRSKQ